MKSRILLSLMVIVIAVSMAVGGTMAYFTDSEKSNGSTITAGTLKIAVNGNDSSGVFNVNPVNVSALAPGDKTPTYSITVQNTGSLKAATFGRFTLLENAYGLAQQFEIYDYQVLYFNADGSPKARYATDDSYYGSMKNEDRFIKEGVSTLFTAAAIGGSADLYTWLTTNGVCDSYGQYGSVGNWDVEALMPFEYYTINFSLKFKEAAGNTLQNTNFKLGYAVVATQPVEAAVAATFSAQYAFDVKWAYSN